MVWSERNPARPVKALAPVTVADACDVNEAAAARRVDEAVFPYVDSNVGVGPPHGVEEHQIAGLKLPGGNRNSLAADAIGVAREPKPRGLAIDAPDETAAIKTSRRGIPAIAVWNTDITQGTTYDFALRIRDDG